MAILVMSYCSSSTSLSPCASYLRASSFLRVGGVGVGRGRKKTLAQKGSSCYSFGWPLPLPRKPVALGMGSENSGEPEGICSLEVYQDAGSTDVPTAQGIFGVLTHIGPDLVCQYDIQLTRLLTGTCAGAHFRLTSIQAPNRLFLSSSLPMREPLLNTETAHLGEL